MTSDVSVVVDRRAECGEGPYWDTGDSTVVWVDIIGKQVLRTSLDGQTAAFDYPEMVGAAAPRTKGGLVLAVESGFALLHADGTLERRIDVLTPPSRMNDAKVDPAGRYWAGSCAMDFRPGGGGLWRLDEHGNAELVLDGLTQPNGLGWSPDGRTMYLVETQDRVLLRFDFDPELSVFTSEATVLASGFDGYPDGLAVDTEGCIWLAEFGRGAVHQLSPEGETIRSVAIPTEQPTSCAFIGAGLTRLWVTSAAAGLDPTASPAAGSVFEIAGHGARGLPVARFAG